MINVNKIINRHCNHSWYARSAYCKLFNSISLDPHNDHVRLHYPHFTDEGTGARETQGNNRIRAFTHHPPLPVRQSDVTWGRKLMFSAGFAKGMAWTSPFFLCPSVPSYVNGSPRTGVRLKQDIWECYFPNYKKKKKSGKDPAGEWVSGPRSLLAVTFLLVCTSPGEAPVRRSPGLMRRPAPTESSSIINPVS